MTSEMAESLQVVEAKICLLGVSGTEGGFLYLDWGRN